MASIGSNYGIKTVLLGESEIDPVSLEKTLHEAGINIPVVKHPALEEGSVIWCRDFMVARPGKPLLMGYSGLREEAMQATALTPPYSLSREEHTKSNSLGSGIIPDENEVEKLVSFMLKHKIPYQRSHCAFDGGNIYLFNDQTGKPRAIIGFNTVVHTYVALKIQRFYEKHQERLQIDVEPSEEAYYAARNMEARKKYQEHEQHILLQNFPEVNKSTLKLHDNYKNELFAPVSKEEKIHFYAQAIEIEKRYRIAKEELGKELGVEDPVFVPQRHYHIDMDLLPLNNKNVVFYHKDNDPCFASYVSKIEMVLRSHGLIPKPVFGMSTFVPKFNMMNALQINNVVVLPTTPELYGRIDEQFIEAVKKEGVRVCRITLKRDLYTLYEGGLRCCTMLIYENAE